MKAIGKRYCQISLCFLKHIFKSMYWVLHKFIFAQCAKNHAWTEMNLKLMSKIAYSGIDVVNRSTGVAVASKETDVSKDFVCLLCQ